MFEDDTSCRNLPPEILLDIFRLLSPKALIKCREVCLHWMSIVDTMVSDDVLWHKYCENDYKNVYKSARRKASGLSPYKIYRSLSLWRNLASAKEYCEELLVATSEENNNRDFAVLSNSIIGVQKTDKIAYYNIETMEPSLRETIFGEYVKYSENHNAIVTLSCYQHLHIVRRFVRSDKQKHHVTWDSVQTYLLLDQKVYFATLDCQIFVCDLEDDDLKSKYLNKVDQNIVCLGFKERLYVLTFQCKQGNIYSIFGSDISLTHTFGVKSNIIWKYLRDLNMFENMDWHVYHQFTSQLVCHYLREPALDIAVVRSYGDMLFVGSNWGILRIYYAPYVFSELDFLNTVPIKEYNFFKELYDVTSNQSKCLILKIDVIEMENGHKVIIATPPKIIVIYFRHFVKEENMNNFISDFNEGND